jgi:DNA-binding response OmpR family regulator
VAARKPPPSRFSPANWSVTRHLPEMVDHNWRLFVVSVNFEKLRTAIFATGVEDVVQRPIKSRELAARIRSILRRTQPALLALEGGPASYKEGTAEEKTTGPTRLPVISAPPENKPTLKSSRIKSFLSGLHKHFSIKCKVN